MSDVYPCPTGQHTDGVESVYAIYTRTGSPRFAKPQRRDLDKWRGQHMKIRQEAMLLFGVPTTILFVIETFKRLGAGDFGNAVGFGLVTVVLLVLSFRTLRGIRDLIRQNVADKKEYDAAVVTRAKQNMNLARQWQNELMYCHKHDIMYLPYASKGFKPEESMSALDPNRGIS